MTKAQAARVARKRPTQAAIALRPARRRLAPAARTELILEEALRLFAERHYSNVTIRDIASACGVNPALIYHYFDSKEDLFRRALSYAMDQLYAGYSDVRACAPDPRAEIMAWLDIHVSIASTVTRMTQLMSDHSASHGDDAGARALIRDFYAFEQTLLEDCIGRGVAAGLFRPVDVARTARTVSLQLDGIFYASASRGDDRIERDIADLRALVAALLDPSA